MERKNNCRDFRERLEFYVFSVANNLNTAVYDGVL